MTKSFEGASSANVCTVDEDDDATSAIVTGCVTCPLMIDACTPKGCDLIGACGTWSVEGDCAASTLTTCYPEVMFEECVIHTCTCCVAEGVSDDGVEFDDDEIAVEGLSL